MSHQTSGGEERVRRSDIGMEFFGFSNESDKIFPASRVKWDSEIVDNDEKFGSLRSPVMINSSELVNDKMVYTITIRLRDCEWEVKKRYSDIEAFHSSLLQEAILDPDDYPPLPKKRWFEINRWTSRHDEEYTKIRRNELQKYLQILFKTHCKILLHKSKCLQSFLEFYHLVDTMKSRQEILNRNDIMDGNVAPLTDDKSGITSEICDNDSDENDYIYEGNNCTEDHGSHRSSLPSLNLLPLKSCLKTVTFSRDDDIFEAKEDFSKTPVIDKQEPKENSFTTQLNGITASDALEELKDFVKVLIL